MGYCYSLDGKLCCDTCGHEGGVRKRTCPYRVHYAEGGSLPLCSPSALCKACYAKHKTTLHEGCKAQAEAATQREVIRKAKLEAGELEVRTAWGDWSTKVPAGFTGVRFVGINGEEYRLLPTADYHGAGYLSGYTTALPWEDHE